MHVLTFTFTTLHLKTTSDLSCSYVLNILKAENGIKTGVFINVNKNLPIKNAR